MLFFNQHRYYRLGLLPFAALLLVPCLIAILINQILIAINKVVSLLSLSRP